jgi:hypothetical protein
MMRRLSCEFGGARCEHMRIAEGDMCRGIVEGDMCRRFVGMAMYVVLEAMG